MVWFNNMKAKDLLCYVGDIKKIVGVMRSILVESIC